MIDIDWEAERKKWQEAYLIDLESRLEHKLSQGDPSTPPRSWSSLSDSTAVARGHTTIEREDNRQPDSPETFAIE